jgi:hypothetical protein
VLVLSSSAAGCQGGLVWPRRCGGWPRQGPCRRARARLDSFPASFPLLPLVPPYMSRASPGSSGRALQGAGNLSRARPARYLPLLPMDPLVYLSSTAFCTTTMVHQYTLPSTNSAPFNRYCGPDWGEEIFAPPRPLPVRRGRRGRRGVCIMVGHWVHYQRLVGDKGEGGGATRKLGSYCLCFLRCLNQGKLCENMHALLQIPGSTSAVRCFRASFVENMQLCTPCRKSLETHKGVRHVLTWFI